MLPRHITAEYQSRSLANLELAGSLALDSAARLARLGSHAVRVQLDLVHAWALALIDGANAPGRAGADAADSPRCLVRGLAANHAELLKVLESQRRLSGQAMHAALEDLHKWTPRVAEAGVSVIEFAVDAVELPTEVVADTLVQVVAPREEGGAAPRPSVA